MTSGENAVSEQAAKQPTMETGLILQSHNDRKAKRGCQAKNSDISSKDQESAPEGFQRATGKSFGGALGRRPKLIRANDSWKGCFLKCPEFA